MNNIFEKRRARLLAMKALRSSYLPPEQVMTCPACRQDSSRKAVAEASLSVPNAATTGPWGAISA